MASPRVVFGMPAYHRPDMLAEVLESLLAQTYRDFAVVIVDDRPTPEIRAIVDRYAQRDPRLIYEPNPVRLGMVGNWRRAFTRSRALYPGSEYFAWASDHDRWHPRWLEVLVGALDSHADVVLAYPQIVRVFPKYRKLINRPFDTLGVTSPLARVYGATSGMITAGNSIYGLFRASPLERVGVFHAVLRPDRLTLLELALIGQFKQVPDYLWYRGVSGNFSLERQRQMLFAAGAPLYTYIPVNLQHFGVLVWHFALQGRGRPAFGRLTGLVYAAAQLGYGTIRELTRDDSRWRNALRRTAVGRRLLPGGRAARDGRRRLSAAAGSAR